MIKKYRTRRKTDESRIYLSGTDCFDENGKVDMEAMKRQFDHLIESGLNGIADHG